MIDLADLLAAVRPPNLVLVDVDGVVADFITAAHKAIGEPILAPHHLEYDFFTGFASADEDESYMTAREFWRHIDDRGPLFWESIPVLPTGRRLVIELERAGANWAFCTKPPSHPVVGFQQGRTNWCRAHFPDSRLVTTEDKYLLARPGTVLIDDLPENTSDFREFGGAAYLWPQPWNMSALVSVVTNPGAVYE